MTGDFPREFAEVFRQLARCIQGFGPYQADAVLTGGLVPVLYRRVLGCSSVMPPRTTFDLDWTLPAPLLHREQCLHERMLELGFNPRRSGSADFPVVQYVPSVEAEGASSGIYVEFLTPRRGGKHNRSGKNQGILEVQPGLFAQTDPYLGLLLVNTLRVSASEIPELALSDPHVLQLPNPMSFIVQKTLIRPRRGESKRESDLCHIYDVATLTHECWEKLRAMHKELAECGMFPKGWIPTSRRPCKNYLRRRHRRARWRFPGIILEWCRRTMRCRRWPRSLPTVG